jgi:hypothetical protein
MAEKSDVDEAVQTALWGTADIPNTPAAAAVTDASAGSREPEAAEMVLSDRE